MANSCSNFTWFLGAARNALLVSTNCNGTSTTGRIKYSPKFTTVASISVIMTGLPFSLDLVSFLPPFHSTRRHSLGELLMESYFLRCGIQYSPKFTTLFYCNHRNWTSLRQVCRPRRHIDK
ncbi:hypothetical protein Fcan01_20157 [Folsomia candida]|uniref:Uncharacterized protein n=1 Tax=Folsomia candida TaxID=158441 RepID=A0A226DJG4_FOLCA|nr:hypothetical protein Fcan01_20157 [Folsomia candida]